MARPPDVRLGILGGSFDPIHNAHLIVAQLAREALGLDRVLLVVSGTQPLKGGHHAPAADRLRMVELAVAPIAGLEADGREIRRQGPSFMVETLEELAREHPGSELVLLLGADAAAELPRWRDPARIGELARLVLFRRGDEAVPAGSATFAVPRLELSSTAIRARIRAGLGIRGWVPEAVVGYISGLALYQGEGGPE